MGRLAVEFLYGGVGELAPPYYVVPRIEGKLHLEPVLFGIVFTHDGAFPAGAGAAVILDDHQGTVFQLRGPFRHQDGVQGQFRSHLFPAHHHHEIRDGGLVQAQFRFRSGREVFNSAQFDETLRRPAEPTVQLPFGREGTQDQGLHLPAGAGSGSVHHNASAALAPGRVLPPQHLQRLVLGVGIAVYHPHRALQGHLLIYQQLLHAAVGTERISHILFGGVTRVEGDHRKAASVPCLQLFLYLDYIHCLCRNEDIVLIK